MIESLPNSRWEAGEILHEIVKNQKNAPVCRGFTGAVLLFHRGLDLVAQAEAGAIGNLIVLNSRITGFFWFSALVVRKRITFFRLAV